MITSQRGSKLSLMAKRLLAMFIVVALMASQAGCGNIISSKKKEMIFATGGTSGTYFSLGDAMANILNTKLSNSTLAIYSTGGSGENIRLISERKADLAIVQNDVMYYAYTGTDLYADKGTFTEFSAVAGIYDECVQIVTCRDDIHTVDDLRGKIVSVGDSGSGVEFNARQILSAYGMTFSDIHAENSSFANSADNLADGSIDAAFIVAGLPTKAVMDLSEKNAVHLVAIDDEHVKILQENYSFYTRSTVPDGTYPGLNESTDTVSVRATLIASNRLERDKVYEFLTLLFSEKEKISAGEKNFSTFELEDSLNGIDIPFHKGARKYYEEQGVEGF